MKTTAAKTAKAAKQELKEKFPDTKFSVTSDNFSMGNAVRVRWTDGPLTDDVKAVVDKYQYGHFDGMHDIYEHSNRRDDIPQVKYVTTERRASDDAKNEIIEEIEKDYPDLEPFDPDKLYEYEIPGHGREYGSTIIMQRFYQKDYTKSTEHRSSD